MNIFIKIALASMFVLSQSCNSTTAAASEEQQTTEATKNMEQDLTAQGYSKGMLTAQKASKCTYVLVDEKTGVSFDPINLEEGTFGDFKNAEKQVVYYKFGPLRRMNRCPEAQPIFIEDIKKGEN